MTTTFAPARSRVTAVMASHMMPRVAAVPGAGQLVLVHLGLLGLPGLLADGGDDRHLHLGIVLRQGGQTVALEHGIRVLEAVAQGPGGGIHEDVALVHAQLGEQHVQLLGQVDVDGREGDRRPACSPWRRRRWAGNCPPRRCPGRLFLSPSTSATTFRTSASRSMSPGAHHDDRDADAPPPRPWPFWRRRRRRCVGAVGVGALEAQIDQLGAELVHDLLRPGDRDRRRRRRRRSFSVADQSSGATSQTSKATFGSLGISPSKVWNGKALSPPTMTPPRSTWRI